MNNRILIVEDEPKVASFIKAGLEVNGFEIEVAQDGKLGLEKTIKGQFDLVILDINLPKMNGFEVCKQIRLIDAKIPILFLTALGSILNKVNGFNIGADDYLVKPFEFDELLVRIQALIKRSRSDNESKPVLTVADLEMDLNKKTVKRGGKNIDLTAKEFILLEYLLRNKGKIIDRVNISEKIWGLNFDTGSNIIELYIFYLRRKIDKNFAKKLIHTHVGMGYVIKDTEEK